MTVLVISGSMGAGKTTVLGEASDLLSAAAIRHAAIDLDGIIAGPLPAATADAVREQNVRAIVTHFRAAGVERLMVAEAVESRAEREWLRRAIDADTIIVCRLRATVATMQERVRLREPGMLQTQFVERVAALERSLDAAAVEDYTVENEGRSVTDVAREVLTRAGWLQP
jgi:adenylylsulfate kinase-like enzyme